MLDIGIRREDKGCERRAPLTPDHVSELVKDRGLSIAVQPSALRAYSDEEYLAAGASIREDLSDCRIILGIKEVPPERLIPGKPHLFFSHVAKGQPNNMPLLKRVLDLGCTLIDYEPIVDRFGRRLIYFGRHAGYAGMIDALWALGRRMLYEGVETAFANVKRAYEYKSVDDASESIAHFVGRKIREERIHPSLHPLVVGFTGGGNVSQGAQEIYDRLPIVEVDPGDLPSLVGEESISRRAAYKVVFRRSQRVNFSRYLPYLTMVVNGIYWEPHEPRLISNEDLKNLWNDSVTPQLRILADISCDIEGSIEATVKATTPDDPVFVFDPLTRKAEGGVEGRGPVILAVDNLPAELPMDASEHFGDSLFPFISYLVSTDYSAEFEFLALPAAVQGAVVAHKGELTPGYRYLAHPLKEFGS